MLPRGRDTRSCATRTSTSCSCLTLASAWRGWAFFLLARVTASLEVFQTPLVPAVVSLLLPLPPTTRASNCEGLRYEAGYTITCNRPLPNSDTLADGRGPRSSHLAAVNEDEDAVLQEDLPGPPPGCFCSLGMPLLSVLVAQSSHAGNSQTIPASPQFAALHPHRIFRIRWRC